MAFQRILAMTEAEIVALLEKLLLSFPMGQLQVRLPRWLDALESGHPVKEGLYQALCQRASQIGTLGQAEAVLGTMQSVENVQDYHLKGIDLGTGIGSCAIALPEAPEALGHCRNVLDSLYRGPLLCDHDVKSATYGSTFFSDTRHAVYGDDNARGAFGA